MFIVPISPMEPIGSQRELTQAQASGEGQIPFGDILKQSMQNLQETQRVAQEDAYNLAMGSADDLAAIAINSAKATAALELTVETTSRALSAYKEILQTQL